MVAVVGGCGVGAGGWPLLVVAVGTCIAGACVVCIGVFICVTDENLLGTLGVLR
jgi:hypothetical protein